MTTLDQEALQAELKKKKICRFCLSQDQSKITNIYMRDTRIKSSAPLPIQIMAIASIEVFSNDGMPSFVCSDCTSMFEYSYQFKQMCKKADNLLRQYPLTGKWPASLEKPILHIKISPHQTTVGPSKSTKMTQVRIQHSSKPSAPQESLLLPKKILNTSVATKRRIVTGGPVPDISAEHEENMKVVTKVERMDEDCNITLFDKIENNDELSLDDIQQIVDSENVSDTEMYNMDNMPIMVVESGHVNIKPKLLNKSSVRILNKEAEAENEPRLSLPQIKQDVDGNMEVVAQILNVNDQYEDEPDPTNAAPVETNVFPCNFCERTFPLLQLRDIHMKNHSRDRKFQCDSCEKSFYSKYDLQRHSFIHNGEKPYQCSVCVKSFSRTSLLSRHEKSHTDVPKYICVHCERSFLSKADMEKHAEKHNINRPFKCKVCKKGFAFKQGLERHEIVHSRQQPYSCQYCDRSFSTTTKLARHLTAHAGLRPYPCKYCQKSYLLSHHLTRHLRSHKNVDDPINSISFMCMRCNTSFESRDQLITHSASHANETNLSCPLCKDTFNTMPELTSHIQDHSEGEAFACEFCDLIFITSEKLQTHTDLDHSKEMEAYHADDRAQADMKKQEENVENADEKLQSTVNEFLSDDLVSEGNKSATLLKKDIKIEEESPKIINQIIIPNVKLAEENSVLPPMRKRKLTEPVTPVQAEVNRKTINVAVTPKRDANQPTIQSLLKLSKSVTVTRTPSSNTPPLKTVPLRTSTSKTPPSETSHTKPSPKIITVENEPSTSTQLQRSDTLNKNTTVKRVKVQKITVTKAQAAAMAKEGRIKIKDGKIILKKKINM